MIARLDQADRAPNRLHHARALVAEDDGERQLERPAHDLEIRVAEAARADPDEDVVRGEGAELDALDREGLTHLREDRRHVQDRDVFLLRDTVTTRLNLEMGNTAEIVAIALEVKPDFVCMVPENREEVTTEGGLDVAGQQASLGETVRRLEANGSRVSMFIDPDLDQVRAAAAIGTISNRSSSWSMVRARARSKGPTAVRRSAVRCPPTPSAAPTSRAMART